MIWARLALIALLTCGTSTVAQGGESVDWRLLDAELSQLAGAGAGVVARLVPPLEDAALPPPGEEWFIEFEIPGVSADSIVTIEVFHADSLAAAVASEAWLEPVSSWEITPRDHEVGLGGYVRLYISAAIVGEAMREGGLALQFKASGVSPEVLLGGLRSVTARTSREGQVR